MAEDGGCNDLETSEWCVSAQYSMPDYRLAGDGLPGYGLPRAGFAAVDVLQV